MPRSLDTLPPAGFDFRGAELIYNTGERQVYKIRDAFILKRVRYHGGDINSEVATHNFILDNTSVPVPVCYAEWLETDNRGRRWHNILEGKIRGVTLGDAWPSLDYYQKKYIARQVTIYMARLSGFKSTHMESITNRPVINNLFVPKPVHSTLSGCWRTDSQIFDNEFLPALRHARIPEDTISALRRTMPPCQSQLVFTHCDLYVGNIMVDPKTAQVTALIDWESAGFWPAWFQLARHSAGCTTDDGEWKRMLTAMQRENIPHGDHGVVWWCAVQELLLNPSSARAGPWIRLLLRYLSGERVDLVRFREQTRDEPRRNMFGGRAGHYSTMLGSMAYGNYTGAPRRRSPPPRGRR